MNSTIPPNAPLIQRERNLIVRLVTGFIGAPIVFYIIYLGGWLFGMLVLLTIARGLWEFYRLVREEKPFVIPRMAFGIGYVCVPMILVLVIRASEPNGFLWVFGVLLSNWATDTGAYIGGRLFGRNKLAPRISPNKTIEGALTGWITGAVIGCLVFGLAGMLTPRTAILSVIVGISVIVGDLFESALKRRFEVKDAGSIIPGHGGVLDRIDGTLVAAVTTAIFLALTGGL